MVYLLKMVIFYSYVSHYQRVKFKGTATRNSSSPSHVYHASRCLTGSEERAEKIFPGRPGIAPCFDHGNSEYMMIQLETWWYLGDSINNILIIFPLYQQKNPVYPSYPHDIPMISPDLVWLVVWNIFYLSIQLGIIIIPTGPNSIIFQRGRFSSIPPTSHDIP